MNPSSRRLLLPFGFEKVTYGLWWKGLTVQHLGLVAGVAFHYNR